MAAIKLSKRLAAAVRAVRPGCRVADVGCDHGKLSAYLALSGRSAGVVAIDVRPGPLSRAQALFGKYGITEKVRAILGNGLAGIEPDEVDDVIIAGLGFETVADIVAGAPWLKNADKRLILVPATRHAKLRTWLADEGFEIAEETPVAEAGHCYTVMTAQYAGQAARIGAAAAALGSITPKSADGRQYIEQVRRAQRRIANSKAPEAKKRAAREILAYIEKELKIND